MHKFLMELHFLSAIQLNIWDRIYYNYTFSWNYAQSVTKSVTKLFFIFYLFIFNTEIFMYVHGNRFLNKKSKKERFMRALAKHLPLSFLFSSIFHIKNSQVFPSYLYILYLSSHHI